MKGKNMRHFEYKDLGTNSHKFWEISINANKVLVKYGRIGIQNPAENEKSFATKDQAKKYCEKKIREKTSKGYIEN